MSLIMVRNAMQIRWAASDLSILQTHPLTPGLTLANKVPSATHPVLPTLRPQHQLRLGLCFIPIAMALLAVLVVSIIVPLRRRGVIGTGQPHSFRPAILTRRAILILISIMVSAIILVEISCHILPTNEEVSSFSNRVPRSLTKVYVSEEIVRMDKRDTGAAYEITCGIPSDYSLSYVTTM